MFFISFLDSVIFFCLNLFDWQNSHANFHSFFIDLHFTCVYKYICVWFDRQTACTILAIWLVIWCTNITMQIRLNKSITVDIFFINTYEYVCVQFQDLYANIIDNLFTHQNRNRNVAYFFFLCSQAIEMLSRCFSLKCTLCMFEWRANRTCVPYDWFYLCITLQNT